jgi:hexosaminidase
MQRGLVFLFLLSLSVAEAAFAQQPALLPLPSMLEHGKGVLTVTPAHGPSTFTLRYAASHDERLEAGTLRMLERLDRTCGGEVRRSALTAVPSGTPSLTLTVASPGQPVQGIDEAESYSLRVTPDGASLTAVTDVGAMHGMETLLQLTENVQGACVLPAVTITDSPRFPWRGLMIDVVRHFEPVPVLERQLDAMAVAKLNVFHWHLSDDQGFRAESRRYPRLTQVGSDGHYYTQVEMREVVAYARARGIRVVPEFDMPGHSSSWVLAYPELGSGETITALPIVYGTPQSELDPTRESTYKFIDEFIGEMSAIFPDPYFHIGGDETEGKGWLANPRISAFMQKKGFARPAQLQEYFNQRLLPILKKHGKIMIGWDEILTPSLPQDIVIQSWRGEASLGASASKGFQGILSAPYYLDAQKTSAQMFLADPVPANTSLIPAAQRRILGGEVCMWAEQLYPETIDSRIWPRTLAIAERFWSPQNDRDASSMYRRLRIVSLELEDLGLTQLSGPERLRRNLVGRHDPEPLDLLASVTEPVSFHERYQGQRTNGYTSLDRLVDAVVADPPSRQLIAGDVDAVTGSSPVQPPPGPADALSAPAPDLSGTVPEGEMPARTEALADLHRRFLAWQQATPGVLQLSERTPRLNDIDPLAIELTELGALGNEALAFIESRTPAPQSWVQNATAVMAQAEKGSALVRFTFLPSLAKLTAAAASPPTSPQ